LECMRASGARCPAAALPPPTERDYPLAKGSNNTHTHTHNVLFVSFMKPHVCFFNAAIQTASANAFAIAVVNDQPGIDTQCVS
jgi:hypothetical protein